MALTKGLRKCNSPGLHLTFNSELGNRTSWALVGGGHSISPVYGQGELANKAPIPLAWGKLGYPIRGKTGVLGYSSNLVFQTCILGRHISGLSHEWITPSPGLKINPFRSVQNFGSCVLQLNYRAGFGYAVC